MTNQNLEAEIKALIQRLRHTNELPKRPPWAKVSSEYLRGVSEGKWLAAAALEDLLNKG